MITDGQGRLILRNPALKDSLNTETQILISQSLNQDKVIFTDLYQFSSSANIEMDLLMPIDDPASNSGANKY